MVGQIYLFMVDVLYFKGSFERSEKQGLSINVFLVGVLPTNKT